MTILEKGCQGKAAWLPLHYNWPTPTPHGLGPGKPDPKAYPGPFKARERGPLVTPSGAYTPALRVSTQSEFPASATKIRKVVPQ
jgi:hypothetical protein